MSKMGIVSEGYKADNRVLEVTRMATYLAVADITVDEDKLVIVAIDNSDPIAHVAEFTGATGQTILGVIRESAKQDKNIAVIKRGRLNKEAIDMDNITGLKNYEVLELLENQNLLMETLND